jgi:hypothetical protein
MNKTLKFGYDSLGAYTLVKLNVKLTDTEIGILDYVYHLSLKFISNHNGLTRIEGVLPAQNHHDFMKDLRIAILRSKMEVMSNEVRALTRPKRVTITDLDWTKADLDKI